MANTYTLPGVLLSGTHAARVAANTVAKGTLYAETDTGSIFQSDGASWNAWGSTTVVNPMTTSQDVIVGGVSGAPGRLAIGAAGGALVSLNGVVAYNSGTSFPGSKVTGDRYWRTDLGLEAYWDGTRWLTTELFSEPLAFQDLLAPVGGSGGASIYLPLWNGAYDVWVDRIICATTVLTTNNGSNFWTVQFTRQASNSNLGSSFSTASDTAGTNTAHTVTVGALTGTTDRYVTATITKTLSPGNIYLITKVVYRLVLT